MTRQESADLIVSQAALLIKKKIVTWLTSKMLFLSWGPFGPLVAHYANELALFIAKDGEMRVFFLYIDLRVDSQGRDYLGALGAYENAKISGDQNEISKKEELLKLSFERFVRFSN